MIFANPLFLFLIVVTFLKLFRRVFARSCAWVWAFVLLAGLAGAAPIVNAPVASFTAAEAGRTYMTVGGVWNGTSEVTSTTGDTFSVTYTNTGDATAFDIVPRIVLPTGFTRVGNMTVSASSGTPVLGSTPGTTGTIDVDLSGYDLPAGATLTLTFGLTTATSVVSGTYQLSYNRDYSLTNGGALVGQGTSAQQNVLVQAGDTTINITPKQQSKAVGDNATFTVTVTNTGLGGLFDVTLNESTIYPTGNNLQFVSLTKTAPSRAATSSNGGSILTLPYLAPGEVFTADVVATVLSCGSILNNVTSVHRANAVAVTDNASVQLNLLQPLVAYTPPAVTLNYNTPVTVSIPVNNTGFGNARSFKLQSTLNSLPLTVSNVASGWSYDSSTGLFTYTANSGTISNGGSATLSFSVIATNPCTANGAGTVNYTALYTNDCGDAYTIPLQTQSIAAPADEPTVSLTKTVSASRIAVLQQGSYTLTLSATNIANIGTTNVTVTDVLPTQIDYISNTPGPSGGTASYNSSNRTVTWTVPVANLTAARTLTINFSVGSDPCNAGQQPSNTATTSNLTTTRGCTLNATANVSFLITNNPGLSASQFFNVGGSPTGGIYETGNADAAPLNVRDTGEGEFIPFTAGYTFGAAYPGTWAGSTYSDTFGGVTQMVLSSGSLTVTGSFGTVAVPAASITNLNPGFRIDLSFLAGAAYFNNANVAGQSVTFNYRTTAPDAAVPGITRAVTQLTNFVLAGGGSGSGICSTGAQNRFTQGVFYTIGRAQAQVGLSLPSTLEVCQDNLLTLTVSNANAKQSNNVRVTLLNSGTDYTFDTSYTPVYGGAFSSGTMTYAANGGVNPTFTYTGNPLTANGTIQVRVRRKATGNTTPGALTARVDYDSWQTAAAAGRVYNSTGSYTPSAVRQATLALNVTPGSITVTSSSISYITYVTNTDAGKAYGTVLTNTLPVGITVDATATNAANPGYTVSTSAGPGGRQTLTWALGDIASGATVPITLVANVGTISGCSITVNPTIELISATWGCDSSIYSTVTRVSPNYIFPAGKMQVVHDSTQTVARLCSLGKVVIVAKNTGSTNIQNVIISDVVPPSAGFSISGTVQYRVNGGALQNALSAPTGDGSSGNPYVWTSTQIPALAQLVPVGVSGTNQVSIEFNLAATETLASQNPVLSASGTATIACGNAVTSPAQPFTIPIERPNITVVKSGRNVTANPLAPFTSTVYSGAGDAVEWRIVITNNGSATASNLRLSDVLSGSGGAAVINGTGLASNTPFVAGQVISLPDLPVNSSATYTISETLGNTCLTSSRAADVSWGCTNNGATVRSNVTTPGTPTSAATIAMLPVIVSGTDLIQSITSLPGGRALITVSFTNSGGTAYNPAITATIPAGSTLDTTGPITVGGTAADITTVTRTGTTTSPIFTLTGVSAPHMVRYGETVTVSYYVRPTVFDTTFASSFPNLASVETTANGLDPTIPATANITALLNYTTSCGSAQSSTNSISFDPLTPDLDVNPTYPGDVLLTGTGAANYVFTITNNGDAGSIADNINLDFPNLGAGWTINSITLTTAGTGGTTGATISPTGAFTPAQVGTLAQGASAVVTVNAQYSGTPGPLTLVLRARGESRGQDGTTVYGNYSLDQGGRRVVGVTLSKTLLSTSETDTTGANVLIGEEATFRLRADFFGVEGDITGLTIRDTPADSNAPAHTGLSYISHSFVSGVNTITTTASTPTPAATPASLAASRVNFTATTLTAANINSGLNTFAADMVVRCLNLAANTDAKNLRNNLGVSFTYLGQTFRSNDGDDGFSGGTANAGLHAQSDLTVCRSTPTIVKNVRNVTLGGTFAATLSSAQASDVIEYRIVVTNPGSAQRPLYNLSVTDVLPAKFNLSAANVGADTDGNNANIEVPNTSGTSGLGATLAFNQTNTNITPDGSNFNRLDPGKTITLLYRGTLDNSVIPQETLNNAASVLAYSLSLPSGNQTAPQGAANTASGAAQYNVSATAATITINNLTQTKTVVTTSDPSSSGTSNVFIGEQINYRLTVQLPQGTIPDLVIRDSLPAGLSLISTPVVTIGSAISSTAQPTITPSTLPADGNGSALQVQWAFGPRTVAVDTAANRTITIDYVAQVRNGSGNVAGTVLSNTASRSFTGTGGTFTNIASPVTVTVRAPAVTVTRGVRNFTRSPSGPFFTGTNLPYTDATAPDAGDELQYSITVTNAANTAGAYDLNLQDTIPAGTTFVTGSAVVQTATGVTGAAVNNVLVPSISGQVLTWGSNQSTPLNLDLAATATFTLYYRVKVSDTIRPRELLTNAAVVTWTSLNGNPNTNPILSPYNIALGAPNSILGELVGTSSGSSPVGVRLTTSVTKVKSGDTLPRTSTDALGASPSGYRVGDLITYTLTVPCQEGTHPSFVLSDVLPPRLVYNDTVSITPATGAAAFTYSTPTAPGTAPSAGATGTINWNFGSLVNAGDNLSNNDTLTLVYRARVIDPSGIAVTPVDQTLSNSATVNFTRLNADTDNTTSTFTSTPSVAAITARQPQLTLAKDVLSPVAETINGVSGLYMRRPGDTASFRLTITNNGTAPAYNIRVTDILPDGLRGTAPVLTAATLNGTANLAGLTSSATWNNSTGAWVFDLTDSQLLLPSQTLVLTYTVTVDNDSKWKGKTLTNTATINQFFSLPSNNSEAASRRTYAAVGPQTQTLTIGLRIDGFVYHDVQPNNLKDTGEDWSGTAKPTVYANLVAPNNTVVRTVTVPPGAGTFAFDYVPAGNYTIVVTDSATNVVASRPANWLFQFPSTGSIADTLSNADLSNRDFGLNQSTLASPLITKSKSGDTLPISSPASGFRIGDLVTYTVDVQPQEGTLTSFRVTDTLPSGLAFVSTTSIAQVSGTSRYTYTTPTGANAPAAGATGAITWNFGTFTNALLGSTNNTLRIIYTARVLNTGGIATPAAAPATTSSSLANSAVVSYTKPAPDAGTKTAGPATATLSVEQPRLVIAKTRLLPAADNIVMPGSTAQFRLTITNNGTAPAYNTVVTDTLPVGLRTATPVLNAATLNGVNVLASLTPAYTVATGVWTVTLNDAQLLLPSGQTLVLDYTVTVDATAPKGTALSNSALVTSYASKASSDPTERRVYPATALSSQTLISGLQISGFVYNQIIPNGIKDPTEDWTTGTPVFVNLVANADINFGGFTYTANQVLRTVVVPVGTGSYTFPNVPPGTYRIVVTNTDVSVAAAVPTGWNFDTPASGTITPVALTNADLTGQNFGLYQGRIISGQVYNDAPPYGTLESETWAGGTPVVVNLVNIYGTPVVYASQAVPVGSGTYSFTNVPPGSYRLVVAPAGQTSATTASVPTGWLFVNPNNGTRDNLSLTFTDIVNQNFGLTQGRTISGFVYNDVTSNGIKDSFEDWQTGTPVVVNLIDLGTNSVYTSALVDIGSGAYSFTNVPPGNYRLIVTNTVTSTTVVAPATWLFRSPSSGSLLLTVAGSDFTNQNFGLYHGRSVSGVVFRDNGSGGTPNDGIRQSGETGIGGVTVRLLSSSSVLLDTAVTDGAGNFSLRVPSTVTNGNTLIVEEVNAPTYRSTGGQPGSAGGSYDRTTDRITFTYPDNDVTALAFGDVPDNAFLTDGAQFILPGASAFYRHTYIPGSGGVVTFSLGSTLNPTAPWTQVLIQDLNGNGQIDPGEPIINGVPLTVTAGQQISLILKDNSPANISIGAISQTVITANFVYTNAVPSLTDVRTRQDVTTIGSASAAGLQLVKAVDKALAAPGEVLTYTVTYTNAGAQQMSNFFIDDRTPAYTVFVSAAAGALPPALTAVNITSPAVNATGPIRWTFTGILSPGSTGNVTFKVKVQ